MQNWLIETQLQNAHIEFCFALAGKEAGWVTAHLGEVEYE